jgi:hypothetical protein
MCFKVAHTKLGARKLKPKLCTTVLATGWLALVTPTCFAEQYVSEVFSNGYPREMAIIDSRSAHNWERGLEARAWSDWAPSKPLAKDVQIKGAIADVGRIYEIEIIKSSSDGQTDADCLQAILGAANYRPWVGYSPDGGRLHWWNWNFTKETPIHRCSSEAISQYFRLHSSVEAGSVAVFRIPLDVLKRYPGQFAESELLSPDNLYVLMSACREEGRPPDNFGALRPQSMYLIIDHYARWQKFFSENPKATKSDIVNFKESLRG